MPGMTHSHEPNDHDAREDIIAQVIRKRRTVNTFQAQAPPRDIILRALELACWAPNHHKTEPWLFWLLGPHTTHQLINLNYDITLESKGQEVAEQKRRVWSLVPGWIVVGCIRSGDPIRQEEDYAATCCAIQNLLLALWSYGVGSKWVTGDIIRRPELFDILGLSQQTHRVVALIMYGYPEKIPTQNRLPLRAVLKELP